MAETKGFTVVVTVISQTKQIKNGEHTHGGRFLCLFPLSLSLIGMDKKSVTCLYKLRIFHFLVPSGQLKIIPSSGFV